ncbi:MAG: HemK family protein methyltransferase, partial [Firmicutes bacterium]|nr:HemK family protein methyltransferase [Bacillota bacterium]
KFVMQIVDLKAGMKNRMAFKKYLYNNWLTKLKPKKKIAKIPVLRGAISFFDSLVMSMTTMYRSAAALDFDDEELAGDSFEAENDPINKNLTFKQIKKRQSERDDYLQKAKDEGLAALAVLDWQKKEEIKWEKIAKRNLIYKQKQEKAQRDKKAKQLKKELEKNQKGGQAGQADGDGESAKDTAKKSEESEIKNTQEGGGGLSRWAILLSVFLGLVFSIGLFFFIPRIISDGLSNRWFYSMSDGASALLNNLIAGVLRVAIFVLYIALTTFISGMKRSYMFHGAEHKTINWFESTYLKANSAPNSALNSSPSQTKTTNTTHLNLNTSLCPKTIGGKVKQDTIKDIKKFSTTHNRCGTTFMFLVMVISILVFSLVDIGLNSIFSEANNLEISSGFVKNLFYMVIRLVIFLPIIAGISFEILMALSKTKENWFVRFVRFPGLLLQKMTAKQPDDEMIEVALTALLEVLQMEKDKDRQPKKFGQISMGQARAKVSFLVKKMGIEQAEGDWILCDVLKVKRGGLGQIADDFLLTKDQYFALNSLLKQRGLGFALDYCLGKSEFYGQDIAVDQNVLVPRMETEILVENAIEYIKYLQAKRLNQENERVRQAAENKKREDEFKLYPTFSNSNSNLSVNQLNDDEVLNRLSGQSLVSTKKVKVLDLCTGSGCIAKAISANTDALILATDICDKALNVARQNLKHSGVLIEKSDLFDALSGKKFNLIVSNPPYIPTGEIASLQKEVRLQPHLALDGGKDGLDFYKKIASGCGQFLTKNGCIMLEVGAGQAGYVEWLLSQNGFETVIISDLCGIERVVVGQRVN